MSDDEIPLTGGRTVVGVVRVGDTVRRPATRHAAFARDLLLQLERQGFEGVPRFLGVDSEGREILSFLEGDVPADLAHFEDRTLAAAAALLRRFHDATVAIAQRWQHDAEVVCHNDWGPTNTVFHRGVPSGLIDFDTAAPGRRLWDIGYSAFLWLDLGNADYSGGEQARRLAVFAHGYGRSGCGPAAIVPLAIERQRLLARRGELDGNVALARWAADAASWTERHLAARV